MLDLANVRTDSRVLDMAAGTGDQTLFAARRVGANGCVLATDISADMLTAAAEAARKAGLTNVETRVMDAESLDLNADSFDAVICRLGLMLVSNPAKVLRAMRQVVRPGGKVAALVFSTAEKNPHQGIILGVARRFGSASLPLFSLGASNVLENSFKDSGLLNVTVQEVTFRRHFSSIPELIRRLKEGAFLRGPIAKLGEAERKQAWVEVEEELSQFQGRTALKYLASFSSGWGRSRSRSNRI